MDHVTRFRVSPPLFDVICTVLGLIELICCCLITFAMKIHSFLQNEAVLGCHEELFTPILDPPNLPTQHLQTPTFKCFYLNIFCRIPGNGTEAVDRTFQLTVIKKIFFINA